MKVDPYLHAALLLHGAGKEVSKENIISVLKAAGADVSEAKAEVLAQALKTVNIDEAVASASIPVAAAPVSAQQAVPHDEQKKEEKKEEKKLDEAATAEGLASLFG